MTEYIGTYYDKEMFEKKICTRHNAKLSVYTDDEWDTFGIVKNVIMNLNYEDGSYSVISQVKKCIRKINQTAGIRIFRKGSQEDLIPTHKHNE